MKDVFDFKTRSAIFLALSALLQISLNLCLRFFFYKVRVCSALGSGGSGWWRGGGAGEDAIGLNGFLTLKCSKNKAFSSQAQHGILCQHSILCC